MLYGIGVKDWIEGARVPPKRCVLAALMIVAFGPMGPVMANELKPIIHHVEIKGFAFVPPSIEVHAGDTIEFTNRDFAPHTVTEDGAAWDTGALRNGVSARVIAARIGTVAYHCSYHPQMNGVIVVALPSKGEER